MFANACASARFKGEAQEILLVPSAGEGALLLVGLGKRDSAAGLRRAAAQAAQQVPQDATWSLELPEDLDPSSRATSWCAVAEGVLLSTYQFRVEAKERARQVQGPCTLVAPASEMVTAKRAIERALAVCEGITLARDLTNTPAQDLGPGELADAAASLARRHGMRCSVLRGDQIKEQGLRLIEAVGRGSSRPPTFTVIEHCNEGAEPQIALIGKGVVFDSGGLDLKPSDSMLLMRKDMAGAAAVLGVLETVARLRLRVELMAIVPAAENSIGPDAYRPGDIIRSLDSLTVEIGNTDAEGRLLLADAIAFARKKSARRLLDLATLTGAARVALGPDVPALFGTDEALVQALLESSRRQDEMMWRLPLVDSYDNQIDSPFADVNNISSDRRAGAITAALFLRRFVRDTPWAHVDFFGWEETGRPGTPKGANGACVRTLVDVLETMKSFRDSSG